MRSSGASRNRQDKKSACTSAADVQNSRKTMSVPQLKRTGDNTTSLESAIASCQRRSRAKVAVSEWSQCFFEPFLTTSIFGLHRA